MTHDEWENWRADWLARCPLVQAQIRQQHTTGQMVAALGCSRGAVERWLHAEINPVAPKKHKKRRYISALIAYCGLPEQGLILAWRRWFQERRVEEPSLNGTVTVRAKPMRRPTPEEVEAWQLRNPTPLGRWLHQQGYTLYRLVDELNRKGRVDPNEPRSVEIKRTDPAYVGVVLLRRWALGKQRPWLEFGMGDIFIRLAAFMEFDVNDLIFMWQAWYDRHPLRVWRRACAGIVLSDNEKIAAAEREVEEFEKLQRSRQGVEQHQAYDGPGPGEYRDFLENLGKVQPE